MNRFLQSCTIGIGLSLATAQGLLAQEADPLAQLKNVPLNEITAALNGRIGSMVIVDLPESTQALLRTDFNQLALPALSSLSHSNDVHSRLESVLSDTMQGMIRFPILNQDMVPELLSILQADRLAAIARYAEVSEVLITPDMKAAGVVLNVNSVWMLRVGSTYALRELGLNSRGSVAEVVMAASASIERLDPLAAQPIPAEITAGLNLIDPSDQPTIAPQPPRECVLLVKPVSPSRMIVVTVPSACPADFELGLDGVDSSIQDQFGGLPLPAEQLDLLVQELYSRLLGIDAGDHLPLHPARRGSSMP